MFTAIVQGSINATVKHPTLERAKLLLVQPIHPVTGVAEGFPHVAIDVLGAGNGNRVLVSSDGPATQQMLKTDKTCPARLAITAILTERSIQVQAAR